MRLVALIVIAGCHPASPVVANTAPAERETLWDHGTFVDPAGDYTEDFTIRRTAGGDKVEVVAGGSRSGLPSDGAVAQLTPACDPNATLPGVELSQQEPVGFDHDRTLLYRELIYRASKRKLLVVCDHSKLAGVLAGKRVFVRKGDDELVRDLQGLSSE